MRIVIDMQGAQTESRFRGIGRYTLSFAQAIVRNRGNHDVYLALSGLFPDTIESIRAAFDGLLPQENIRVWYAPGPVSSMDSENDVRREIAELVREAFLMSFQPDVIHIASLFEGYIGIDNAVTSIGRLDHRTPVSVALYDLIPLLNPSHYFKSNERFEKYYLQKIGYLNQASVCLAISEFSRQEGIDHLDLSGESIVNVSTAIESHIGNCHVDNKSVVSVHQKFGINRPYVLYTGGGDERKNLPRLIQAYSGLSAHLRETHQLVFAGQIHDVPHLLALAKTTGLRSDELCFTGYVSDSDLVTFYNACKLFVFPSWHEGFGLPVLEAMACGAPVICANTTSLPEVIGLDNALFDPLDIISLATKMTQALEDDSFRATLREHGLQRSKLFSWDETAKRAIAAWERLHTQHTRMIGYVDRTRADTKFVEAIAQQLPTSNEAILATLATCIAQNQSAGVERQLFVDVSELSQRDSATGVQRVVRSYLKWLLQSPPVGFRIEPVYATQAEGYRYARRFTQRFLGQDAEHVSDDPVRLQRGDVFFGLDMQHHVQLAHAVFFRQIQSDGVTVKFLVYDLLPIQLTDLFQDSNAKALHEQWLTMIAATDGAICISKATANAYDAWISEAGIRTATTFQTTCVHIGGDIEGSQPSVGLPLDAGVTLNAIRSRPSFLCVSTLEPRKGQQQIVDAVQLLWDAGLDVNLVLVGQQGWKTEALAERLRQHPEQGERLFWLQGISDEYLEQIYGACTCLIAASVNEGFGLSLIEAARHAVPIVARDIPVFREIAGECAFYFTGNTAHDLAASLKAWMGLFHSDRHPKSDRLNWSTWQVSTENLKAALVKQNYPRHQLLVDISELVQRDAKTGIQRVVRSILKEWLLHPPDGYRVEPVYATTERRYCYARHFSQIFIGAPGDPAQDELISYSPGDAFMGLDLNHHVPRVHEDFLTEMYQAGVTVRFLVYDLLPIQFPEYWESKHSVHKVVQHWLSVITKFDGAVCISKSVANDLTSWVKEFGGKRQRCLKIDWFHLGADVDNSEPTGGLPMDAATVLELLRCRTSFLSVGTLEPRKGHTQAVAAFEKLWQSGEDVNLVIVGKQGWLVDSLIEKLRIHPERNKHLFWLEGISDEYLEKVYAASTCLIAASFGEGFGLPLIEAAQHQLPIIARDIPVFREVAGRHAYYFDGHSPDDLAQAIQTWLSLHQDQRHPESANMPWLTWKESAESLLQFCVQTRATNSSSIYSQLK
jgi:glycosyltransferase involved in cell wall biosynthesis